MPIRPLNEYRLMESSTREYRIAESRVHTRAGNNRNESGYIEMIRSESDSSLSSDNRGNNSRNEDSGRGGR